MTMKVKTKLAQALSNGKPALTAECLPPLSANRATLAKLEQSLPECLDAVLVSDHHHGPSGSALACAALLAAQKKEPVLPVITRDKNRIALESDVLGAATLGIRSFLCLSGAHQSLGASRQAAGVYDLDSTQLIQALERMTTEGVGFAGETLDSAPDLFVGAVAHPYLRPLELGLIELRKKVAAGARALWTDPVFDLESFEQWMDAVRATGLDQKAAIIASVVPLTSAAAARELRARPGYGAGVGDETVKRLEQASNPAEAGLALCAELAQKLSTIRGVRGIHLLSGGHEESISRVIAAAHLA
jgi:methylenetetrahydrofolate reductase (NADPH)